MAPKFIFIYSQIKKLEFIALLTQLEIKLML